MSVIQMNVHHGFWARLRRLPRGWIGAALIALVVLGAVFAPQIAPAAPTFQFRDGLAVDGTPLPPSGQFMLGTDNLGRDVLSRVLYGAQVSLFVALTANVTAAILGTIAGLAAGYYSGWVDALLMRFTDILLAFPAILLALGLSAILRPSFGVVTIIITVIAWPGLARVIRSQVLVVRERAFIESARAVGAGDLYIIVRHILPHIVTITVIWATLSLASTVLIEASLSYLDSASRRRRQAGAT